MIENINIALVFGAGLASVLSPCVLPIIPIVVTGTSDEHRLRPLLIVAGLSVAFMSMGILSSLFGSLIGAKMFYMEKIAGVLIALFGALLLLNVNLFKHLSFFSSFAQRSRGNLGGLLLGITLGIVWIPCVGPMLSAVLAMVATEGKVVHGISLLFVYSLGFAVPMLIAGYFSQLFRKRIKGISRHPILVNTISGTILISLGVFILLKGMTGFGSLL